MKESNPNDTPQQRAFRAFEALVAGDDAAIDLALAALLIACSEYPDLNFAQCIAQLDSLALRVRSLLGLPAPYILPQLPPETDVLEEDLIYSGNYFEHVCFGWKLWEDIWCRQI